MSSKEESSRLLTSSVHEDGHRSVSNGFCRRVVDSLLVFRQKKLITVEVAVFLYCFSMYMTNLVSQQFMYQYFEVHYLRELGYRNFSISGMCIDPKLQFESCGNEQMTVQHCVQRDTSYLIRNLTIATTIIMSITILFMGPLTDKVGRKFALVLAALGSMVSFALSLLLIYLHLPIRPVIIAAGVINGATGGLGSTLVGAYTYITDISTHRYRTLRLGLIVTMMFISGGISQYVSGIWLYHNNCTYEHLLWFAMSVNALEVLFVLFGFPESRTATTQDAGQTVIKKRCNCSFCNPKDCLEVIKVSLVKFIKGLRIFLRFQLVTVELWLALLAGMLYVMNSVGIETITTAFLKGYPLFWNSEKLGTYNAMLFGLSGGFVVLLLPILSVLLKLPDPLIALLGTVPAVMAYFMVAYLGPTLTTWKMFLLGASTCSVSLVVSTMRSWMSKRVARDEIGALFSYTGFMEVVIAAVAAAIYDSLFPNFGQNSFYLMSGLYATLLLVALFLLVIHAARVCFYKKQFSAIDRSRQASPVN